MRCPPGLVFDDVYQRCEWPGAGTPSINQRLGSLRDRKFDEINKTIHKSGKLKVKQPRLLTSTKQSNSTLTRVSTSTSVSSSNTTKFVEP
jgi:hypothetical protein